jgi:hypothetical protein
VTGVDLLFTKEFYALAREHLSPNGILLQWVQAYDANIQMAGMIVNTVMQEFKRCHVFLANQGDLLIVATDRVFTKDDLERAEDFLRNNEAARASLDMIHLSSLDTILLRELWSPSYIRSFFSDFGTQTMDHPRLHYLAGKTFFMGISIPGDVLLGPGTIPFISDYLLVRRHPNWADFAFDSETFKSFVESARDVVSGHDFSIAPALRLKAYLSDSNRFPLTEQEKQLLMVDLIPLITGKARDEDAWTKVGLKGASYRRKAEAMLSHLGRYRNWIVPYPIDGLKTLLQEGIIHGTNAQEKNWFALQSVSVLMYQRAEMDQIKRVLDNLQRDKDGRVLLEKGDEGLLESIEMQLKKVS